MMKRLTSIALILCFLLTLAPAFASADDSAETVSAYSETEELFMSLGIIEDGRYAPAQKLTRAEFAYIMAKTARLIDEDNTNQWREENFGDTPAGTVEPTVSMFGDVDPANEYYEAIVAVKNAGYMRGVGENLFAPDLQLITSEAVKVIVDTLGYDTMAQMYGGYPAGYLTAANRLKLLSGVSSAYNDFITQADVITIICNAMEVGVGELVGVTDENIEVKGSKENSFMKEIMGIDCVEGIITDNGITCLNSATKVGSDYMQIGSVTLSHSQNSKRFRSLIGRYVTAYYDVKTEGKNILLHAVAEDEAIEISSDDFLSYSNGVIKYTKGSKTVSEDIGKSAKMIYNGAFTKSYTASDFDIEDGKITILEDTSAGKVVIVEDMKNMYISTVSDTTVYNKLNFSPIGDEIKSIDLEEGEKYANVDISDTKGNALSVSDIKVGDVLSVAASKGGEYAKVIVSRDVLSAVEVYSFDGEAYETANGEIYAAEAFEKATNKNSVKYNALHNLYMNTYGKIVWVEYAGEAAADKVAILLDSADTSSGLSSSYAVKLYTENAKITVFSLSERITLNGERTDVEDALAELKANQAKPVLYVEKDGIVTSITTPAPYGTDAADDKRGWYKVTHDIEHLEQGNMSNEDWDKYVWKHFYIYSNAGNGAAYTIRSDGSQTGPRVSILTHDANTKFYKVPTNPDDFDDDKLFSIVTKPSFPENSYFAIDGYSRTAKDSCPEIMVQRQNARGSGNPGESSAFLITKIKNGINSDEDPVVILEGYVLKQNSAKKEELKINVDAIMLDTENSQIDEAKPASQVGPRTYNELQAGDIVRYSTNALGEVNTMRIAFDYDEKNAFGRDGGYDTASYGGVMSITDKAMKVFESKTLNMEDFDYSNMDYVTSTRVYPLTATSVVFIAEKDARGSLTFRQATTKDIIAYENTLVPGEYDHVATVAHWFGGFLATVVYR